jgi:hypothetical protein
MTRFTVVVLAIATVVAALLASTGADLSASPSMFFPTASYIYVYIRRFCIIIQGADEVTGYASMQATQTNRHCHIYQRERFVLQRRR